MTATVLKTFFPRQSPTRIKYRNYKQFDEILFRQEIQNKLGELNADDIDYDILHTIFMNTLETH